MGGGGGLLDNVISIISAVLWETTIAISDSTGEPVSMESEIVRRVSLNTTEISDITPLKSDLQDPYTFNHLFTNYYKFWK